MKRKKREENGKKISGFSESNSDREAINRGKERDRTKMPVSKETVRRKVQPPAREREKKMRGRQIEQKKTNSICASARLLVCVAKDEE